MTSIAQFNAQAIEATDLEHSEQLGLLQALGDAVECGADSTQVARQLDALIAYSEAHFVSEELLMRMKSYDDYEDHQDDHAHMLAQMRAMAVDHANGNSALIPGKVKDVLDFIGRHIATRDKRLADYVRTNR
ncbi:MAG: hemerythrin family protein [Rhodoferax sp.]|nr:hemerythrin family protein [Rhodoferax sp.]